MLTSVQARHIIARNLIAQDIDLDGLELGQCWRVQTVNLHHLALARHDTTFREALTGASHLTADGWPVVALARSAGIPASRVTGSDWIRRLTRSGALRDHRLALIGGSDETRRGFEKLAGFTFAWAETGDKSGWDAAELARRLIESRVDVLLIAVTPPFGDVVGAGIQKAGYAGSVLSVGGGVDMLVGSQPRAPRAVRQVGGEWLWRLARSPRRLGHRYIVQCIPAFVALVLPNLLSPASRQAH